MKTVLHIFLIFFTLYFSSCTTDSEPIDEDPFVTGAITNIDFKEDGTVNRILVEENPEINDPMKPGGIKIWFTLTEKTEVLHSQENKSDSQHLEQGLIVSAWIIKGGMLADSYPQQTTAQRILVIHQ